MEQTKKTENMLLSELKDNLVSAKKLTKKYYKTQRRWRDLANKIFVIENAHFSGKYFKIDNKHRVSFVHVRKPIYDGYFDAAIISREHGRLEYVFKPDCQLMIDLGSMGRELKDIGRAEYIAMSNMILNEMLED